MPFLAVVSPEFVSRLLGRDVTAVRTSATEQNRTNSVIIQYPYFQLTKSEEPQETLSPCVYL